MTAPRSRPASGATRNESEMFASGASQSAQLSAQIEAVEAAGYVVFKAGNCRYGDIPHGRHSTATRSSMCPGSDPLPHAWVTGHFGSFGWINHCACGEDFPDYSRSDEPSPWEQHKAEHGIVTEVRGLSNGT